MKILEIIHGILLGDGSIRSDKNKYFTFQLVAKDKELLEWFRKLYNNFGIKCWISKNKSNLFLLGFYINSCPFAEFLSLRKEWYKQENGKTVKIIPRNLKLTPTTLLFWYLGDGSLIRRRYDSNRVPFIVLATNTFSKEDIDFLIHKLKELNLNFYPVKYKSGFTGKSCGYCIYSNTQDGTPFRFFKLLGFKCPKEIENCSSGSKGIYKEEKFFKGKWPTEEDWIKIFSNTKEISEIIKQKRKQLSLTQREVRSIGMTREHIRDIENGRRCASVHIFKAVLKALNLDITYLLEELGQDNDSTSKMF